MARREGVELCAGAGGDRQGMCPGAGCRWWWVCTRAQCKGQGEGVCAAAQCEVRAVCTMAQCEGWGHSPWLSAGGVGAQWLSAGDAEGRVPWLSAGCGGQGTCNVAQCKGRVTRTMTQHVGCVARAGAGTEPPGCIWHLSGPCCGHCSPWGSGRGATWQHHSLAPPSFTRMTSWSPPPRGHCTPWARTARLSHGTGWSWLLPH